MRTSTISRTGKARAKALWTRLPWAGVKPKAREPRWTKVRKQSDAMAKRMREYRKLATRFKLANPSCDCGGRTRDVHHTRGRAGSLLLDWRYWRPVCRYCHDWIAQHPDAARAEGMLCERGLWNVPDRTPIPPMP